MPYSNEVLAQLGHPSGQMGAAVLDRLNVVNRAMNAMALAALGPAPGANVLEIGFGGGAFLAAALAQHPASRFHGAEISALAVARAEDRFATEIAAGQLRLHHYDGRHLPSPNGAHNAAVTVNVIYFLPDLPAFLAEIRRVLAPGGRCVLAYSERAPDGVTRFPQRAVEARMIAAGFAGVETRSGDDPETDHHHATSGHVPR